jgi:hypothetical protein
MGLSEVRNWWGRSLWAWACQLCHQPLRGAPYHCDLSFTAILDAEYE